MSHSALQLETSTPPLIPITISLTCRRAGSIWRSFNSKTQRSEGARVDKWLEENPGKGIGPLVEAYAQIRG